MTTPWLIALTATDVTPYAIVFGAVSSVCAILAFIWKLSAAMLKVQTDTRDAIRDMATKIGSKVPPEGLLGDVQEIKQEVKEFKDKQDADHEKLVVIETNVAQRRSSDKKGN